VFTSVRIIAVSLVASLALATLSGCATGAAPRDIAGKVVDDTVVLQVPALPMPSVDLDAGFTPGAATVGSAGARRSAVATAVAFTGLGSVVRVSSVSAKTGENVGAGQEIARLDSAALDANVAIAKANRATARAQVGVLGDALDAVALNRSTLASKRAQINNAAAQLTTTRAKLAAQLAELKALLAKIEAARGSGGRPPGRVPPGGGSPGGTSPPGTLPDPAKLRAGIVQLTAALAKIDAGLAKVSAGRTQLASASAKLADARTQLKDLRVLARIAADAAEVGVRLAEYQRELAVLRSPVDGVVVSVVAVGEVLSPGATVAVIRRREASRVTTWIAPEGLGSLRVGSSAEVRADWLSADTLRGRVSSVGTRAEYPPTSFATSEIHLTRAIPVEVTLTGTADQPALPPGAPVDVRFLGK
jgi:multidrug resistance efflux pump